MLENNFYQSTQNIAKAGAYYTDLAHCARLSQAFNWPEGEVSVLEPSAGDGAAVIEITNNCDKPKIFAVELRTEAFRELKNNSNITCAINCDFLQAKISNNVFSFMFANPPYINGMDGRMEVEFLQRSTRYIAEDGIIVYVVPYSVATSREYLSFLLRNYKVIHAFRFDEAEYEKYKQIVFIARKVKNEGIEEELQRYMAMRKEDFPLIPEVWTDEYELVDVEESPESKIVYFSSKEFNREEAFIDLCECEPQKKNLDALSIKAFSANDMGRPPVMPNQNVLYLLSTLGCGSGITGSEDNMDIHLQRGNARICEYSFEEVNEKGNVEAVTQRSTKVSVTILENDGTFTVLE
ncbi:MAG: hypothetical protein K6G88_10965 [Lachnospiraceae bacterium]|nr:hypothetical protein [Lachnospiraceae bacterium]